ncbi:MAG: M24 family metallopeptidase [Lachnospiraceae bacterium]
MTLSWQANVVRISDAIARDYIYSHGYEGRFGHGLGHSVGIDIHEEPRLSMTCSAILEENQIMTVEPGIYLPRCGRQCASRDLRHRRVSDRLHPLTSPTREPSLSCDSPTGRIINQFYTI